MSATTVRRRGRPPGGGNPPEHARELLLDAAERSFAQRGYRASTMQVIAREAGYTRAVIYRHFATRDELLDALVVRVAGRKMADIATRMQPAADPGELVTESLVIVATEVGHDPLLRVISEHTDEGNVAALIARSATLSQVLAGQFEIGFRQAGDYLRAGLRPADAARFVLSVALGLLLGLIPGVDDADQVRRYVRVFVLPALVADPPPAAPVFTPLG
ncbi:TetR/AcrR family transcriptional regulator [Mycobacterium talmoniae]|uniref:Putative HTH-type transcriptional regulator n=1 Tax=Mycobacterium talmoniae TaxID=1858794 RepID=A0A1S1NMY9_9MYCO|nr:MULTISPECIES: TetR/AcrR family transcriptional regulator [Mycobacterium]OHV05670.1 TetR family transcriptional regulator [Mycobacterium talmoniae]PQM45845.1 putative HTH-type transcriptional regulator [Mycobacterium talmoniae]TDH52718.1 TetR/AcrR family transcriptional regulator [Mycobacterium eburneum]